MDHFAASGIGSNFFLDVSRGNIPGYSFIHKFGENPDIDTVSGFEDIWDVGGTYVPPTVQRIHDIVSESTSDAGNVVSSGTATTKTTAASIIDSAATFVSDGVAVGDEIVNDSNVQIGTVVFVTSETELNLAGLMRNPIIGSIGDGFAVGDAYRVVETTSTGASIAFIEGLNTARSELREFIVLNGTTNVPTVGSYRRMDRARLFGGDNSSAVGAITATAQTDGTISLKVLIGNNQTMMAIYTVPLAQDAFLTKWWGTVSKKNTTASNVILRGGVLDGFRYALQTRAITTTGSSSFDYIPEPYIVIPGGADIWVEADSSANDTGISSGFDLILIDR